VAAVTLRRWALLGLALGLLGSGLLLHGWAGSGLLLAGWAGLVGLLAAPLRPLLGAQVHYRIRYHTASDLPVELPRVGRHLVALATHGGRVTLTWQRRSPTELALYASVPSGVAGVFHTMAPTLWPGVTLETVVAVPIPRPLAGVYRVALRDNLVDCAALVSAPESPAVIWIHWQESGGALLIGVGSGQRRPAGARRVWRRGGLGRARWWGRYWPLIGPWPAAGAPGVRWPPTTIPATAALDPHTAVLLPPPAGYRGGPGAAVGQAVTAAYAITPDQLGHGLVVEPDRGQRGRWVGYQVRQAMRAGWGLVVVDSETGVLDQLYAQAGVTWQRRMIHLDLRQSRPVVRPGLLAAAADATPAELLRDLGDRLARTLPIYLRYLGYLGLTPATVGVAAPLVPAWVSALLIAHYRARIDGVSPPPLPEIPALYRAWSNPDHLGELLAREVAAWQTPSPALQAAAAAQGAAGPPLSARVVRTLTTAQATLAAIPTTDQRMYTLGLRGRLAGVATAAGLTPYWQGTQDGERLLIATARQPLLVTLPGATRLPEQRTAGDRYGLYLLHLLEVVAARRASRPAGVVPLLVVWAGVGALWRQLPPAALTRVSTCLAAGQVFVLGSDSDLRAFSAAQAAAVLAAWPTWVCGALDSLTGDRVQAALPPAGLPAGWSWAALPLGLALARVPADPGAFVCTVRLAQTVDLAGTVPHGAAGAVGGA